MVYSASSSGLALAEGVGGTGGGEQCDRGDTHTEYRGAGVGQSAVRLGGGLLGTVVLAVGLAGFAGPLDKLIGSVLDLLLRLVHFLLVG